MRDVKHIVGVVGASTIVRIMALLSLVRDGTSDSLGSSSTSTSHPAIGLPQTSLVTSLTLETGCVTLALGRVLAIGTVWPTSSRGWSGSRNLSWSNALSGDTRVGTSLTRWAPGKTKRTTIVGRVVDARVVASSTGTELVGRAIGVVETGAPA